MRNKQLYHIYPLGYTGANQETNDGILHDRLTEIEKMVPHLKAMNVSIVLLGPVFESASHGYDVIDYSKVDRRLGNNDDLKRLIATLHRHDIEVMLDCVFNHISRQHPVFVNVLDKREASVYRDWIQDLDLTGENASKDALSYACWDGHESLVKLNLQADSVRHYLIETALGWIREFDIDGLRMDAADVMSLDFLKELSNRLKAQKEGFIMLGEIVHGDYRTLINEGGMDCVTNYEAYKGLYSSLNDINYHEIGYTLNRQFGSGGIYPASGMVNFVDNHDVERIASRLDDSVHQYPIHLMLFTIPGIPAIYYGSEYGIEGQKTKDSDEMLRPYWKKITRQNHDLLKVIQKLSHIRVKHLALRNGGYQQVHVAPQTIGFKRTWQGEDVLVFINASHEEKHIPTPLIHGAYYDVLNDCDYEANGYMHMYPNWGRILVRR